MSNNQLQELKKFTTIVADTGNFEEIKKFHPQDATTNPSLILKAVMQAEYRQLLDKAIGDNNRSNLLKSERYKKIIHDTLILFGREILKIVPGRVSTEVDARLSFDTEATLTEARYLIDLYKSNGIDRERILIKIASTWEGIQAAKILQKEGINCNMTLIFSMPQAVASAEAKVRLISPFVGRIYDYYKTIKCKEFFGLEDPGVQSVHKIYNYFRKFGYETEVMGASFRNTTEVVALAGCDLLTISPNILEELEASHDPVIRMLSPELSKSMSIEKIAHNEKDYRWLLNEDAMATEKLSEGIRKFAEDIAHLERMIAEID